MSLSKRSLVPGYVAALRPYVAGGSVEEVARTYGLSRVVKLASNENPLGASPQAVERMRQSLDSLHLYPTGLDLRAHLAGRFGTKLENVITGSGSEGIMANIVRTFLSDDDEALTSEGTFIGFEVLVRGRGIPIRTVALRPDWHIDLVAMAAAITGRTKIIYLANPNNPTGTIFSRAEFDDFYRHVPPHVLIILDEAYFEYAQDNRTYPDSMSYRYDNVITLRTFSKIYGLAGVRIGYGFAHEDLIASLMKIKLPFEPSALGNAAGIGAINDHAFLDRTLEHNRKALRSVVSHLSLLGFATVASQANFVMLPLGSVEAAQQLTQFLVERGVIIRSLANFGLPACVRISIGTEEENAFLIDTLRKTS